MPTVQVKLTEFSDLITRYTADFVGREWLVKQVNALLDDPGCRFVVLTGGPGVGKTAFLAHLAATRPQWPRYFIRRDSKDLLRPGDANTFLLTIGGQLATLYPQLFHPENLEVVVRQQIGNVEAGGEATGARIEELHASPFHRVALLVEQEIQRVAGKATGIEIGRLVAEPRLMKLQDLQYMSLLDPARLLAQEQPNARIVVLVDALDELRYSPAEPDVLRTLRELPELPANVRFVVSSRPEAFLGRLLARNDARELPLDVAGDDNQNDLQAYEENMVASDAVKAIMLTEQVESAIFVRDLLGKSAGNFLYLKSVLTGIQDALVDPAKQERLRCLLHVEELPADLGALYGYFIAAIVDSEQRRFGETVWREYLRPLLGTLAVAQEPLSEKMIMEFARLKREDIRDVLRELRQFVESVGDEPSLYRIYHTSFAEYLLDSERNRDYWIDGQEKHSYLANYYLNIWGGLDANLPGLQDAVKRDLDGGYGLRHLVVHLEEADRTDDLHHLFAMETDEHRNVWYEAKDVVGDTASFLADVARVWRLVEADSEHNAKERNRAIGLQCRYALISASINSLATNIPPALLFALVKNGIWLPAKGLAYARLEGGLLGSVSPQREEPAFRRIKALTALLPLLPEMLKEQVLIEALATLERIFVHSSSDDRLRYLQAEAIRAVVPRLIELGQCKSALAIMRESLSEEVQEDLLEALIHRWAELGHCDEALATARGIRREQIRIRAMIGLIPYLPKALEEQVIREMLAAVRDIDYGGSQAARLGDLAPYLPDHLLQDALLLPQMIKKEDDQASALAGLLPRLAELGHYQDALEFAQKIGNERYRAEALAKMAPHLPKHLLQEALTVIWEIKSKDAQEEGLAGLLPRLAELGYYQDALELAQKIGDERYWAMALAKMAPHIPRPLLHAYVVYEGLNKANEEGCGAIALSELARQLMGLGSYEDALAVIRKIVYKDITIWAQTLADLVLRLPNALKEKVLWDALATVRKLDWKQDSASALAKLAPCLSESMLREALVIARGILSSEHRTRALEGLAPHLPVSLLQNALGVTRGIKDKDAQAAIYAGLAPCLPAAMKEYALRDALTMAREIKQKDDRALVLVGLASHLPEPLRGQSLREALDAAHREMWNSLLLARLTHKLAELGYYQEALDVIRGLEYDHDQADALVSIAFHLPDPFLEEALMMARVIKDKYSLAMALVGLIPYLSDTLKEQALHEAITAVWNIEWKPNWARLLAKLAPHLPDALKEQTMRNALTTVRKIEDNSHQAEALAVLAPHLPDTLRKQVFQDALAAAQTIKDKYSQAEALMGLIPYLPDPLKGQTVENALAVALKVWHGLSRASLLVKLVPHLPGSLRDQALYEALISEREFGGHHDMLPELVNYLINLPHQVLTHVWLEVKDGTNFLHILAKQSRPTLLVDFRALVPVILALGGEESMVEIFHAIQDVDRWWP